MDYLVHIFLLVLVGHVAYAFSQTTIVLNESAVECNYYEILYGKKSYIIILEAL